MADFESQRIITPEISFGCNMTLSPEGIYHNTMVYSFLPSSSRLERIEYWLGLLNSKLLWWFLANTGSVLRGGYFRFKTNYLNAFPLHSINFLDSYEKKIHDKIVEMVEYILEKNKEKMKSKNEREKNLTKNQIDEIDKKIDQMVYELYELNDDEIEAIEAAM
jgi:hypothetical protein